MGLKTTTTKKKTGYFFCLTVEATAVSKYRPPLSFIIAYDKSLNVKHQTCHTHKLSVTEIFVFPPVLSLIVFFLWRTLAELYLFSPQ